MNGCIRSSNRLLAPLVGFLTIVGCEEVSSPPRPTATGPAPSLRATVQFGDSPVEGTLHIEPGATTAGWTYAIDLDGDGDADLGGDLEGPIAFDYRFAEQGAHEIVVGLVGPDGPEVREVPVIVNRRNAIEIVAQITVVPLVGNAPIFEGITVGKNGEFVYVGDWYNGDIHAVDVTKFETIAVADLRAKGVEALSISPSGEYLLPVFKRTGMYRFRLPTLEAEFARPDYFMVGFWGYALDERRLVEAGGGALELHDVMTGEVLGRRSELTVTRQFDVDPRGGRIAGIERTVEGSFIHLVELPSLSTTRTYALSNGRRPSRVAFGPFGERLYIIAQRATDEGTQQWFLLTLNLSTGAIEEDLILDRATCGDLCVANPVARSREGRFVAFETWHGVLIVDTSTGLPLARGPLGSVSASPTEDATFWVLRADGILRKIVVYP